MKKIIMFVMVLAIATPAVALMWEPHSPGFAGCPGSGQVLWEFTEAGCMPTSDVADPPYHFDPPVPDPVFGTSRDADGGPRAGWTWSGGVYTVNDEDGLNQPIPDRGGKQYLRMYVEVVHTMVESTDPSLIGFALEIWDRDTWEGCPTGANGMGDYDGYYFPPPTDTFDLGGGWHQSYWEFDFSTEVGAEFESPILQDATHTAVLFGMTDLDSNIYPFDIEEVYINYIWYNNADGSDVPDEDCVSLVEPGKKLLIVDVNDIPIYEPQDTGGPPPMGPTEGQLQVSLAWRPGEDPCYPNELGHYAPEFTVTVVVDPDPNQEHVGSADFSFPDSTEPNDNITLYFTQANWNQYQNVHVEATEDLLPEGIETFKVELTVTIDIADCNFGGPGCDPVVDTASVRVIDNDIPYISVLPSGHLLNVLTEENPGVPRCVYVTLSHQPIDDVDVFVQRESNYDFLLESMSVMDPPLGVLDDPNKLTFTTTTATPVENPVTCTDWNPATLTSCWNFPQQICLEAIDDDELAEAWVEWVLGQILFNSYSDDPRYQSSEEGGELGQLAVNFNVQDNECGSVGYPPYDKNEDCYIDLAEIVGLYGQWLTCTDPFDGGYNLWGDCDAEWNLVEE